MERNGMERVECNGMGWVGMKTRVDGMVEHIGLERYVPYFAEHCGVVLVPYSGASSQAPAAGPGLRLAGESVFVVRVVVVVRLLGLVSVAVVVTFTLESRSPWSHKGSAGALGRPEKNILK